MTNVPEFRLIDLFTTLLAIATLGAAVVAAFVMFRNLSNKLDEAIRLQTESLTALSKVCEQLRPAKEPNEPEAPPWHPPGTH